MSDLQIRQIKLTVLKLKNLTYIQQTNNKILTESPGYISHLCSVINWLLFGFVVKKMPASKEPAFLLCGIYKG
jgi:hypothetical protein